MVNERSGTTTNAGEQSAQAPPAVLPPPIEAFELKSAEVRSQRAWVFVGYLALLAAMPVVVPRLPPHVASLSFFAALLLAAGILERVRRRSPRKRRGDVFADKTGLYVDGMHVLRRGSVRSAYVVGRDRTLVRFHTPLGRVDVDVDDIAKGESLIRAMRLDPARSIVLFRMLNGRLGQSLAVTLASALVFAAAMIGGFHWIRRHTGLGLALATASLLFAAFAFVTSRRLLSILVGADGVRVHRGFADVRILRYADMESVEREGSTVVFRLLDGSSLEMSSVASTGDMDDEVAALVARVATGIDAHRRRRETGEQTTLARAERSLMQWVFALHSAVDAVASYRSLAIPIDVLWSVLEDVSAPPTARVGAAVALGPALDDPGRARVREVAEASVHPALRTALVSAAGHQGVAAVFTALEALEHERTLPRRSWS